MSAHISFHMHEGDTLSGAARHSEDLAHRWFVLSVGNESLTVHYDRGVTSSVARTLRKIANQVEDHELMQPTT